jgi:hypothetical protein
MGRPLYSQRAGRQRKTDIDALRAELLWQRLLDAQKEGLYRGVFTDVVENHVSLAGRSIPNADQYLMRTVHQKIPFLVMVLTGERVPFNPSQPKEWRTDSDLVFDCLEVIHDALPLEGEQLTGRPARLLHQNPRGRFRELVNPELAMGDQPYVLLVNGEIVPQPGDDQRELVDAPTPETVPGEVAARFEHAKAEFLRRGASLEAKRLALTELAGLIEHYKKTIESNWVSKDERMLREIANTFGIRHTNDTQKVDFDKAIYYDWMFQVFAASVLASMRVEDRRVDA